MRRLVIFFLFIPFTGLAQPSDFIILKKKDKTVKRFYAGTQIEFVTTTGAYRDGVIKRIANDSLYLQEFLIRRVPTQLGYFVTDTAGSFSYVYHFNQVASIGKPQKGFNVRGSGAALLGGGVLLTLASSVVYLADREKFSPALLIASVGLGTLGYFMSKSGGKGIVIGKKNYSLEYINLTGDAKGDLKLWLQKEVCGGKIWRFFAWLFILQLVYIVVCKWINPPITITQLVSVFRGDGLKRDYISFDEMDRDIKLAVMAGEDQMFPSHNGFDIKAIRKAIKHNEKNPRRTRGASTISQQVAKNVFLWQGGGFFRKGLEVYFTFMIEKIWGKERILQMYLNVAEMGPGIFGVQAAAKEFFKKDAAALSRMEAAMIAASLPNPKKFTVQPLSRYVSRRSGLLVRQMNNLEQTPEVQELLK